MNQGNIASLVFVDGCVVEDGTYFFSSRLDVLRDGDFNHGRLSAYRHGAWFYQDRAEQVESVCIKRETASDPVRASIGLERMSGSVGVYWKGEAGPRDEHLPGHPGSFGPMSQIVQVEGTLYACGIDASVYRREAGGWAVFNQGLNAKTLRDYQADGHSFDDALRMHIQKQDHLLSIGGCGNTLYVCGMRGLVCYRSDGIWQRMEVPTNVHLYKIKCVSERQVYIAGEKGVLLLGNSSGFRVIATGINDDFTCLEWFEGKLYVGGGKRLYVLDGERLHVVDTKQKGDYWCVALDGHGGQLMVVSERWFLIFDGTAWKRIDDPDNVAPP